MITITYPWQDVQSLSLDAILWQSPYTLLYFYPKDNTPWCTREAIDFSLKQKELQMRDVQVIGVSQDPHTSHCSFHSKHSLTIPLISDPDHVLHNDMRFRVWGEKSMYGKKYMGTVRSTFLLDTQWEVLKEWRDVSVTGHADMVLEYIQHNIW